MSRMPVLLTIWHSYSPTRIWKPCSAISVTAPGAKTPLSTSTRRSWRSMTPSCGECAGVYYTPEPVVSYIVRSVDHLLKTRFGCPAGLADTARTEDRHPRVLVLDPACGTGTFLYAVVDHIREAFRQQGNAGMWSGFVREHLLPRLFGFELLMGAYAVAHFKLGMQLAAQDLPSQDRDTWAYDFAGDDRLGVYLTNTLEEAVQRSDMLMARFISDEANAAADVKGELPIMVVLGNPPYAGHSANASWRLERIGPRSDRTRRVRTWIGDRLPNVLRGR